MSDKKLYTVNSFSTHFVEATNEQEAMDIVYEALLGNDPNKVLQNGEVNDSLIIVRVGYHSNIKDKEYSK